MRVPIRATADDLEDDLRRARGLFSDTFSPIGKAAAGVSGGLTLDRALQSLLGGVRAVVNELADAERQMLQTEARLRSTGGAAGVTAASISEMAQALARLSGGAPGLGNVDRDIPLLDEGGSCGRRVWRTRTRPRW